MSIYCPEKMADTVYLDCQDCDRVCKWFHCLLHDVGKDIDQNIFQDKMDRLLVRQQNVALIIADDSDCLPVIRRYAADKKYRVRMIAEKDIYRYLSGFRNCGCVIGNGVSVNDPFVKRLQGNRIQVRKI